MKTTLRALVVLGLFLGATLSAHADCWYCRDRAGFGSGGHKCALVTADGGTGSTYCRHEWVGVYVCEVGGNNCMNVVVVGGGGTGGGSGSGGGGGGGCFITGSSNCPSSCSFCIYQVY
jgi:hypothetical protein